MASCPSGLYTSSYLRASFRAWAHCPILTWVLSPSQWGKVGMWPSHNKILYFPSGSVRESEKSTLKSHFGKEGNITSSCYKDCWGVLSRILGIAHHNLSRAVKHRQLVQKFALLERRKKQDGVSTKTKEPSDIVVDCWDTSKPQQKKCHM
jgi:hypothetical protein